MAKRRANEVREENNMANPDVLKRKRELRKRPFYGICGNEDVVTVSEREQKRTAGATKKETDSSIKA
jgi:hypothetical protein